MLRHPFKPFKQYRGYTLYWGMVAFYLLGQTINKNFGEIPKFMCQFYNWHMANSWVIQTLKSFSLS